MQKKFVCLHKIGEQIKVSVPEASNDKQSSAKCLKQIKGITLNEKGLEIFDINFCVICYH